MWSFLKQSPNPMFAWGRVHRYHGFCYPLNSSPTDSPLSTAFENARLSQGKAGGGGIVQCRPVIKNTLSLIRIVVGILILRSLKMRGLVIAGLH